MYKKGIILLTFLAYSLTLVHSLVPHHHHDDKTITHHHHGNDDHHPHDDDDDNGTSINHVFADAIHNPASEAFVTAQEYPGIQKKNKVDTILVLKHEELLDPELKPPDWTISHQKKYRSSDPDSFFLLRAPPAA